MRRSFQDLHIPHGTPVLAVLLLLAACAAGCGDDNAAGPSIRHPQDFLPPGTEAMPKDGTPRSATNVDGLQLIVDGGFEVYTNHGFREIVEQMYGGTVAGQSATVRVWIVDVGNLDQALALNEELRQVGTWQDVGSVGDESHLRTTLTGFTFLFRRDRYSSQIDISRNSQDAEDLVVMFATHVDDEIQE